MPDDTPPTGAAAMTVAELVDHIQTGFHQVERDLMERISELMVGLREPPRAAIAPVCDAFEALAEELRSHMDKEEKVLFPWIRAGRGDLAHAPVRVMALEHRETLALLDALRERVRALDGPGHRRHLPTGVASALESLDRHVREHMHLEDDVLFPRALRGEG